MLWIFTFDSFSRRKFWFTGKLGKTVQNEPKKVICCGFWLLLVFLGEFPLNNLFFFMFFFFFFFSGEPIVCCEMGWGYTQFTHFFYKKAIFWLNLNFLKKMLEIRLRFFFFFFFWIFFLTFISLFYLVRFKTNNKCYFLTYMLTGVTNFTTSQLMISKK